MSFASCGWALPEKIFRSPNPVAISPAPLRGGLFMPFLLPSAFARGVAAVAAFVLGRRPASRSSPACRVFPSHFATNACPAEARHPEPTAREGWLGRKDSNLRIRDPKTRALPLGHAPVRLGSVRNRPPVLTETLSVGEVTVDYQIETPGPWLHGPRSGSRPSGWRRRRFECAAARDSRPSGGAAAVPRGHRARPKSNAVRPCGT